MGFRVSVIAVGKLKEKHFADAFGEYEKRLAAFCAFETLELAEGRGNNPAETVEAEGRDILSKLEKSGGLAVALDRTGDTLSSEEFSRLIAEARDRVGAVSFLIGGSHGLSGAVLSRADKKISFGKMTFPHQLFRVMLAEQIYRGAMILGNREYHK